MGADTNACKGAALALLTTPLYADCSTHYRKSKGSTMTYVDGFILPLKKKNLPAYRRMARKASKIWREHGALEYYECIGDDLDVKGLLPFTKLASTLPGETVIFSWVIYKSRAARDRANAKIMQDPRMHQFAASMPFDMTRMAYGGFKILVKA